MKIFLLLLIIPTLVFAKQGLPSLAVGIVQKNRKPTIATYGVKSVNGQDPIDSATLFPIASCTKPFTCQMVHDLVESGVLSWDDRACDYLPFLDDQITLRHMATHTTGYPRSDHLWHDLEVTQEEVMERLAHLTPTDRPGEAFEYSNMVYLALGKVIEEATRHPFEEEMTKRVLKPLKMESTTFSPSSSYESAAKGHQLIDGQLTEVSYCDTTAVAPAGALLSNIEDMVRFISFQLTQDLAALADLATPYISTADGHYGLGWFITEYKGYTVVEHPGGIRGFSALVSLIPSEGIGLVLLTNCEDSETLRALSRLCYDQLLTSPFECDLSAAQELVFSDKAL